MEKEIRRNKKVESESRKPKSGAKKYKNTKIINKVIEYKYGKVKIW